MTIDIAKILGWMLVLLIILNGDMNWPTFFVIFLLSSKFELTFEEE